jgi:SAM-dependent methyltransferase
MDAIATERFCDAFPGHQAALDLYAGAWATAMPEGSGLQAGEREHFNDVRVPWAAKILGGLSGKTILELGPYEAYNTHQFETMGAASVVAIENSRDNFLKCLIIKNVLGLRATFLYGDMLRYLHEAEVRFDICWASGVLYHMSNPTRLLEGLARISNTLFIWTHYIHPSRADDPGVYSFLEPEKNRTLEVGGKEITLHHRNYHEIGSNFSGGPESYSYWMTQEDILHVLATLGFTHINMGVDNPKHAPGAACFFLASKMRD